MSLLIQCNESDVLVNARQWNIRDVFWLIALTAVSLSWWKDHSEMRKMSVQQEFDYYALSWEKWCEANSFSSTVDLADHESVRKLIGMGPPIVPMIFARWPERSNPETDTIRPPWWLVLQAITGKKMVDTEEIRKLSPPHLRNAVSDKSSSIPDLEEQRWRTWWQSEGRNQF